MGNLVQKKKDAIGVNDYRPISMEGSIRKVIPKILSRRLREVLPHLVGDSQSTFVRSRKILDGALVANEIVSYLKKRKRSGVLLKLDIEKAYDTID